MLAQQKRAWLRFGCKQWELSLYAGEWTRMWCKTHLNYSARAMQWWGCSLFAGSALWMSFGSSHFSLPPTRPLCGWVIMGVSGWCDAQSLENRRNLEGRIKLGPEIKGWGRGLYCKVYCLKTIDLSCREKLLLHLSAKWKWIKAVGCSAWVCSWNKPKPTPKSQCFKENNLLNCSLEHISLLSWGGCYEWGVGTKRYTWCLLSVC